MINILLNLLYPQRCPLCHRIRPYGEMAACRDCVGKLKPVAAPGCMKCGKTIENELEEYCRDCRTIPKSFKRGFPAFLYEGAIKSSLYEFKYKNQRNYAEFYADSILGIYGREIKKAGVDGIIPVPVHPRKRKKRGYNQAELLAKDLGKRLGIRVYSHYLERCENTSPQKELNDKERLKNLKNAFKIRQNEIKLEKVLLVDDIYTSGATIEACTRVLLPAGTHTVYYTSVAIGRGYSG